MISDSKGKLLDSLEWKGVTNYETDIVSYEEKLTISLIKAIEYESGNTTKVWTPDFLKEFSI